MKNHKTNTYFKWCTRCEEYKTCLGRRSKFCIDCIRKSAPNIRGKFNTRLKNYDEINKIMVKL